MKFVLQVLGEDEEERITKVAGSFLYMAPEVGANLLNENNYNYKADMWSIGCVLYQCLTGKVCLDFYFEVNF